MIHTNEFQNIKILRVHRLKSSSDCLPHQSRKVEGLFGMESDPFDSQGKASDLNR